MVDPVVVIIWGEVVHPVVIQRDLVIMRGEVVHPMVMAKAKAKDLLHLNGSYLKTQRKRKIFQMNVGKKGEMY
jgi:hypothetical protein